ncbi:STAS domain-containing protein [Streptomyces sp. ME08-AFT2]|uniref:STAS domain-containing protein n=1 Tax=Streptomyces sp. ME08-AFT2 TaxID=3028683 RepID=UPI0029A85113|nr:STAS domain-containing protein [Streptomyces sp. ME08-AFT2]MDX3308150.1 STAS domain-containing protein [Streptomyces sp. ME08-AFT2]
MADEGPARPQPGTVRIAEADGQRVVLAFSGVLDAHVLRELEERLLDQRLRQAGVWVLEMSELDRMDLACAYALLRAVTSAPEPAALTVRGARRNVQRTLRHAGIDVVATIEE